MIHAAVCIIPVGLYTLRSGEQMIYVEAVVMQTTERMMYSITVVMCVASGMRQISAEMSHLSVEMLRAVG